MEDTAERRFQASLATFLRARYPYLYVATWEEVRVLSLIQDLAEDKLVRTPRKVFVWSLTEGLVEDGTHVNRDSEPLQTLDFIENYREPAVFILKDFHIYFGSKGRAAEFKVIRRLRDLVPSLIRSANPKNVIFISPSLSLPADLEKDITIIDFDLPSTGEIDKKLQDIIKEQGDRLKYPPSREDRERLVKAAIGLTLQEAENAFARALVEDGKLSGNSVNRILDEKRQVIKKMEILEFIPSGLDLNKDVGGLENLKRWLEKRNKSWIGSEVERYGLEAPKGVLITGIPGCGKSLIAKAISAKWQLPLVPNYFV